MPLLQGFSAHLVGAKRAEIASAPAIRPGVFWPAVALAAGAWLVPILWLHAHNSRLLPSWHGFLHTAIATRFPGSAPPENPFFAGERLPYYWFYHYVAAWLARLSGTDLLHAFQFIALASLVILVVFAAMIGREHFRSLGAGLLIGYLAVAGVNPLGFAIAAAKRFIAGQALFDAAPAVVENVFVSNRMADELMTQPLLPGLYVFADWRLGQNLAWFLDVSSRTPALALVMVLLFLLLGWRLTFTRVIAVIFSAALMTALNPLIGIAASGSLAAAFFTLSLWRAALTPRGDDFTSRPKSSPRDYFQRSEMFLCASLLAGPALALPTYYHLLFLDGTSGMTGMGYIGVKIAALSADFLLLVPLALLGLRLAPARIAARLGAVAVAGLLLLLTAAVVSVEPMGNEHNLVNIAQCLLAAPAVAWIPGLAWGRRRWLAPALVFAMFLPTTVCALIAYTGRPGLPLGFGDQTLNRKPEHDALNQFYVWVKGQTPSDAVFISDPNQPVKMSGNVAEFPAFTSRALFTDHPTYMTRPYKDAQLRAEIAAAAAAGQPLPPAQLNYLLRLRRPLYVVTYQAGDKARLDRLTKRHGEPAFHKEFVAAFKFNMPAEVSSDQRALKASAHGLSQ